MCGVAAHFSERLEIALALDAFRDRDHIQAMCKLDDAATFAMPVRRLGTAIYFAAINFNSLNGSFCACSSVA